TARTRGRQGVRPLTTRHPRHVLGYTRSPGPARALCGGALPDGADRDRGLVAANKRCDSAGARRRRGLVGSERLQMGSKETAKARNSTRAACGDSPVQAQALLSLQSTAGNRAVASSLPVQRAKG